MEALEILAGNLSNATTAGFKADRERHWQYVAPEAGPDGLSPVTAPTLGRSWTDFSQGGLQHTGKSTDLALGGYGFFVLGGPRGHLYSRAGSFQINQEGILTSADGLNVLDNQSQPIRLSPAAEFRISESGSVSQNGAEVAQLRIVSIDKPETLVKAGNGHFALGGNAEGGDGAKPGVAQVHQGYLETSNVQPAESAVRMIHVLRQFESLQKALTLAGEMNRRVLDEVAKVHA